MCIIVIGGVVVLFRILYKHEFFLFFVDWGFLWIAIVIYREGSFISLVLIVIWVVAVVIRRIMVNAKKVVR